MSCRLHRRWTCWQWAVFHCASIAMPKKSKRGRLRLQLVPECVAEGRLKRTLHTFCIFSSSTYRFSKIQRPNQVQVLFSTVQHRSALFSTVQHTVVGWSFIAALKARLATFLNDLQGAGCPLSRKILSEIRFLRPCRDWLTGRICSLSMNRSDTTQPWHFQTYIADAHRIWYRICIGVLKRFDILFLV